MKKKIKKIKKKVSKKNLKKTRRQTIDKQTKRLKALSLQKLMGFKLQPFIKVYDDFMYFAELPSGRGIPSVDTRGRDFAVPETFFETILYNILL